MFIKYIVVTRYLFNRNSSDLFRQIFNFMASDAISYIDSIHVNKYYFFINYNIKSIHGINTYAF